MENRIDQLEEKNHSVFHHKSSMKPVLCPRGKGRLSRVPEALESGHTAPGCQFASHHFLSHPRPFLTLPPQSSEAYTSSPANSGATSSREPSLISAETTNPFSVGAPSSVFTASLGRLCLVFRESGGLACPPPLHTTVLCMGSHTEQLKMKTARNRLNAEKSADASKLPYFRRRATQETSLGILGSATHLRSAVSGLGNAGQAPEPF